MSSHRGMPWTDSEPRTYDPDPDHAILADPSLDHAFAELSRPTRKILSGLAVIVALLIFGALLGIGQPPQVEALLADPTPQLPPSLQEVTPDAGVVDSDGVTHITTTTGSWVAAEPPPHGPWTALPFTAGVAASLHNATTLSVVGHDLSVTTVPVQSHAPITDDVAWAYALRRPERPVVRGPEALYVSGFPSISIDQVDAPLGEPPLRLRTVIVDVPGEYWVVVTISTPLTEPDTDPDTNPGSNPPGPSTSDELLEQIVIRV